MIKEFLREFGLDLATIMAGFGGALASITKEKELTIGQRVITVVVGGLVAGYMTPILGRMINMGEEVRYGLGFVLGYTGLRGVEWIINKWFKKIPPSDNENENS